MALALGCTGTGTPGVCHAQQQVIGSVEPTESKFGLGRLFGSFAPKSNAPSTPQVPTRAPDDPLALSSRAEPSAHLYVAVARLHQDAGRLADAEQQYRLALEREPDHLDALLGYARLKERMRQPQAALELYGRAAKAHPDQPVAMNNLGLCLARQGQLQQAATAIARAVQLRPDEPLYRNNLATLLVDMGRLPEAFAHLRAVHSNAAAYYNLGYLLVKKGDRQAAVQHFRMALQLDPSLVQARQWLNSLEGEVSVARRPTTGAQPPGRTAPPDTTAPPAPDQQRGTPAGFSAPSPGTTRLVDRRTVRPAPVLPSQSPRAPVQGYRALQPSARPTPNADSRPASGAAPMPPSVSSLRRLPPTRPAGPQQPFSAPTPSGPSASGSAGPSAPWPPAYQR